MSIENVFKQVQLLTDKQTATLRNFGYPLKYANTKYDNFTNMQGSLGNSVNVAKPFRSVAADGINPPTQGMSKRFQTLAVTQATTVKNAWDVFADQFYSETFLDEITISQSAAIATAIEQNLMRTISGTMVGSQDYNTDVVGNNAFAGITQVGSGPYRFYGNGTTPLGYTDFGIALQQLKAYGQLHRQYDVIMPNLALGPIIGSGVNQFVLNRNERDFESWEIGSYGGMDFFTTNTLEPVQAGTVGDEAVELTVVSNTPIPGDSPGDSTSILVLSGAAGSDPDAVKVGALGQITTAGIYATSFTGYLNTGLKPQFRVLNNSASTAGGQVTLTVTPALVGTTDPLQSVTTPVVAGMKVQIMPTAIRGIIFPRETMYLSMPKLPPRHPFISGISVDPDFNFSLATFYGSVLDTGNTKLITSCTYGGMVLQEYGIAVLFPTTV